MTEREVSSERVSEERLREIEADEGNGMAARMMAGELIALRPYKDELLKIAAIVGERGDPFAAWESVDLLLRSSVKTVGVKEDSQPEKGGVE